MKRDLNAEKYKIIRGEDNTILMLTNDTSEEIKTPVTLSFKNVPFKINLEDNNHLDFLKELKSIILIMSNKRGKPETFMELEIREIF